MKRKLGFVAACVLGVAILTYLYFHSQGSLTAQRQALFTRLSAAHQSEAELDKEILRVQNFSLLNYDSLVKNSSRLKEFCSADVRASFLSVGPKFNAVMDKFCERAGHDDEALELFKSKNAINRNSLIFLHERAIEYLETGRQKKAAAEIVNSALVYETFGRSEARKALEKALKESSKNPSNAELQVIAEHARRVLEIRPVLEGIVRELTSEEMDQILESLNEEFTAKFVQEEATAAFYRKALFGLSLLLAVVVIYSLLGLLRLANALKGANMMLEERVHRRTQALVESQKLVTDQQQALAMSSKLSALGEMAGGLAHEINTPLAVIQMRSDQLLEDLASDTLDPDMLRKSLSAIDQTVRRIGRIVRGLRTFSRDGSRDPKEQVKASDVVEETFVLCRERFANHGVDLSLKMDEDLSFWCRPSEISQVLLNLLNNAYDAIQDRPEKWIRVEISRAEGDVRIDVVDCGQGIPADVREKMMQPFFTTKEVGKGTGLGLSISKRLIENHGGQLLIDPVSENTRISVIIPLGSEMSAAS